MSPSTVFGICPDCVTGELNLPLYRRRTLANRTCVTGSRISGTPTGTIETLDGTTAYFSPAPSPESADRKVSETAYA
jgi:SMC interacting uncharacterized protein involved in chromosome segregation